MKKTYKGIEFAEGYNRPFADFKQTFENVKVFRDMKPKIRAKELKVAHKLAAPEQYKTKSIKNIEVKNAEIIEPDGNLTKSTIKSKKTNSK
ncbi:hypothetical protein M1M24_gp21 [Polaribacter phage Freya_1]|uniref:Uncharacterized protein n=1 Tax=Polaribacter phage Freya_1 TaxID=2745662 RepID=A0A8E4ZD60_9CAUD|nr:hypothetical protein M1M24_gp21 [Polaribacter phage Freya_1]QQV90642.1 hypothetical protein Danklef3_11 [Polaribacter phage Danklef_3]QQV90719.1 hypothetical protein Danklef4_11 [Polaribacter phage Danklef_4]QQV90796.1 hypothetical protein Danklef5_11 [Polaribacter phage Danklef_5]QQV90958.1 hypothetical protein Freya2_21 [Polaribacter phage Freya_2]QQV91026.1 hypothetical protein Freya3_21 [Polaribacter phage Freya_3]QQV91094.1 hypothetical protein Freya4_21 [Polaribacter phage Freya_4]Q